jgi:hypothetical protein
MESVDMIRVLIREYSRVTYFKRDLSASLNSLGRLLEVEGRIQDGTRCFQEGLDIMRALVQDEPGRSDFKHDLSRSLDNLGRVAMAEGRREDATRFLMESFGIVCALFHEEPSNADHAIDLAVSCCNMFVVCPPHDKLRWLMEGRDLSLHLKAQGIRDARILQVYQMCSGELAKRQDFSGSARPRMPSFQAPSRAAFWNAEFQEQIKAHQNPSIRQETPSAAIAPDTTPTRTSCIPYGVVVLILGGLSWWLGFPRAVVLVLGACLVIFILERVRRR